MDEACITLGHGAGGRPMQALIQELLLPLFDNPALSALEDQARLPLPAQPGCRLAMSTDGYVVSPLCFPGGDIGCLAVNGTVNDLAVGGAVPRYLSCAFIIEEGLPMALLRQICQSLAQAARAAGVSIVTGDTKVVPRGQADKLFITTSGVGEIPAGVDLGMHRIAVGDALLVSGPLGDHGATILAARQELGLSCQVHSDTQPLHGLMQALLAKVPGLHCARDLTRGGLNAVAHEFAAASGLSLWLEEAALPIRPSVASLCELLGLDPLQLACEGRLLACVAPAQAAQALAVMAHWPGGERAACVGQVGEAEASPVLLRSELGVVRALAMGEGEALPRIC